jgi:glycosyltransferase involved in cell wall biosynthesis
MKAENKFLLISPAYPPPFVGGALVWMYTLIENSTHNFDILTARLPDSEKEVISTRHIVFRKKVVHSSSNPSRLALLISYTYQLYWVVIHAKKNNYTAILANAEVFQNSLIILLGKIIGIEIIEMGFAEEITVPIYGRDIKSRIKKIFMQWAYPLARGHIVVCDFCKDLLISFGVSEKTIDVIPPAFNRHKMIKRQKNLRIKGSQNIISVGRLVQRKGFIELVDVVKNLKEKFPKITLDIVGNGPLESKLKEKVISEGLQHYIKIHGRVSDAKLARLYSKSDLFVLAHRMLDNGDTEGAPTTFAEAGFYELPSIGGINSGASSIIDDGKTGLIINMKNNEEIITSIQKLFYDRNLLEKMGSAAYEKVLTENTPEVIGMKFQQILNNY